MQVVKEVVMKLNELNIEHDHFIETMEREDLYEFIDTAAQIAGLESEEDITEKWRNGNKGCIYSFIKIHPLFSDWKIRDKQRQSTQLP